MHRYNEVIRSAPGTAFAMGLPISHLFAFLVLINMRFVAGDVTLAELRGGYEFHAGNVDACTNSLKITGAGPVIDNTQVLYDGKPCSTGKIRFTRTLIGDTHMGKDNWGQEAETKIGPLLRGELGTGMVCNGHMFTKAHLLRPRVNTTLYIRKDTTVLAINYDEQVLFFTMWSTDRGGCVFRSSNSKTNADQPTETPKPKPPNDSESPTIALWAWLGPVLGAVATIIAAFITVYCVRNQKANPDHLAH